MNALLPETVQTKGGHLVIGGCDVVDVAEAFGTPLVIFDRKTFDRRASAYGEVLGADRVFYAGKAFLCVAICELVDALGCGIDVSTGGELATALAADFPPERLLLHGNNKSLEELEMAAQAGVGRVVVDSFDEMERIEKAGVSSKLLIRVTPGVEAHTHEFVQTGQEDSKFGFTLLGGVALEAVRCATDLPDCRVVGLHAHIGSQIFELAAFDLAIQRLAELALLIRDDLAVEVEELNLGGGLGIAHTQDETTPDPATSARRMVESVEREFGERGLARPNVLVEPGRSVVGPSAVTVYRVGTVKKIPGVRTYVSVDGGMSDNVRPALYGARYEALLANRVDAARGPRVTVAGKHCESGDVLIRDVHLPDDVAVGDLLCIPATGAYTYSMASNYNRVPRPPVVLVEEGKAQEIVARETYEDLLRLDRWLGESEVER